MADITANRYLIQGTNAERVAFTPVPVDLSVSGPGQFMLPIWYETDTGDLYIWDETAGPAAWVLIVSSGGGGGITELTGDVTAGPGSGAQAATIANQAVTFAKMQNIATDRLLGRDTAGAGSPEELQIANGIEFSGTGIRLTTAERTRQIGITIDGGGSAITTGIKGYRSFPVAGTITGVRMLADQVGSAVVDIWKDTYANYPPTVADTITAAAKPTISAANKSEDTTLTGWTTAVAAGDVFAFNVDSAATITRLTLELTIRIDG